MGIGKNINDQLEIKGMTVAQLSRESGVAATTIYSIIQRDSDSVAVNTLQKVSDALNIEIWDLINIDRETAKQNVDTLDEFGDFYVDNDERKMHELQKEILEREEEERVGYYYSSIVPVLKNLNYKSSMLQHNSEYIIIIEKDNKKWEVPYKDMKEAVTDANYLSNYLLTKKFKKIRKSIEDQLKFLLDKQKNNNNKE